MRQYLTNRAVAGIIALFGATIIIFIIMRVLPGDVVLYMLAGPTGDISRIDPEKLKEVREQLGLERPVYIQYADWIFSIAKGEMGRSLFRKDSVREMIQASAPLTIQLAIQAILISWLVGLPLGLVAALRQNTWLDHLSRVAAVIVMATPSFWLGGLAIVIMVGWFGWFAPLGYVALWVDPMANLQQLLPPSIVLGATLAAAIARMTRSSVLEVLREDFIRTAHAKGLRENVVVRRHMLKVALLPVITISGLQFAALLGGAVVIETVFGLRGLGNLLMQSVLQRDNIVVQNLIFLFAAGFIVINLVVDIAYGWMDPRIRYG